ncbi:hypothetical protein [Paenibacillus tundrae]|uniref:Uncharacterized protein n=1 Tax=Paenibacillus tundrae TaxID=528187 RepID=A0ABT9WES9_9BACL|nr:hypothetical protein [Paenibacillus tundrae]MDQ0171544.1 hypothetical protein [Paenibacillus tundrae]
MKRLNQAIERISAINWNSIGNRESRSHVHLCSEYLRRASIFLKKFPGSCIYPFIVISNSITKSEENFEKFQVLDKINNSYHRVIVDSYLELNALIDEGNQIALENQDLFEPVIKLYERGGSFYKRGGFVNVAGESFEIVDRTNIEPLDISDQKLDQIDIEQDMEILWGNEDNIVIENYLEHALNRINLINFKFEEAEKNSHLILANEFLKRSAYFERFSYLDLSLESPFVNVAEALGYSPILEIEKISPTVSSIQNEVIKSICIQYLELSALVDQGVLRARKYYNVYEPLIKLFERGGEIDLVDNNIVVGSTSVPLSDWYVYAMTRPEYDISIESLNALDS